MSSVEIVTYKLFAYKSYIYIYKQYLALSDLQELICHKPQVTKFT